MFYILTRFGRAFGVWWWVYGVYCVRNCTLTFVSHLSLNFQCTPTSWMLNLSADMLCKNIIIFFASFRSSLHFKLIFTLSRKNRVIHITRGPLRLILMSFDHSMNCVHGRCSRVLSLSLFHSKRHSAFTVHHSPVDETTEYIINIKCIVYNLNWNGEIEPG